MKRVVVIGGGFAGAYIAKKLENYFSVTLIDAKNYFEFTPSVLKVIVEPSHIKRIHALHSAYLNKAKILIGEVKQVTKKEVITKCKDRIMKIVFDYLVIASGTKYQYPFKEQNLILATRANSLKNCYANLFKSKKVLIIGGGVVGVELAAEIIGKYKDKDITIIESNKELIERTPKKAREYARQFLTNKGVKILFREKLVQIKKDIFITDKGVKIKPDISFLCTGITPNFKFMQKNFYSKLNKKNYLKVNDYLQLIGYKNIFAAGDIAGLNEEKLAQNAENHARIIVKNIVNLEKNKSLIHYKQKPRIMVISLGRYNGILNYKNFVFTGIFPGFLKHAIEWKTMIKYR